MYSKIKNGAQFWMKVNNQKLKLKVEMDRQVEILENKVWLGMKKFVAYLTR